MEAEEDATPLLPSQSDQDMEPIEKSSISGSSAETSTEQKDPEDISSNTPPAEEVPAHVQAPTQEISLRECLNTQLTSKEVTGGLVQYLVIHTELIYELPEEVETLIDEQRELQFFRPRPLQDLLMAFPLLKMFYAKLVPRRLTEKAFWRRFVWFVHYYHWRRVRDDWEFREGDTEHEQPLEPLDDEEGPYEVIKFDYHSVDRYIASACLSFLKVFLVCAVLRNYGAPWYFYLYPALWVVIGLLIIGRALQIQRKNNLLKARYDESLAEGTELREMESI